MPHFTIELFHMIKCWPDHIVDVVVVVIAAAINIDKVITHTFTYVEKCYECEMKL